MGCLRGCGIIGHGQGAAKPPLYVNTLAALALVMGRDHAVAGAWVMASAMAALLAFLTYRLFEPVVGEGFAVVAAMGVTAMPAVANWDALAYPDTQMTAIALAVIVLLANGGGRWGWRRSAWLGVLLGAGHVGEADVRGGGRAGGDVVVVAGRREERVRRTVAGLRGGGGDGGGDGFGLVWEQLAERVVVRAVCQGRGAGPGGDADAACDGVGERVFAGRGGVSDFGGLRGGDRVGVGEGGEAVRTVVGWGVAAAGLFGDGELAE